MSDQREPRVGDVWEYPPLLERRTVVRVTEGLVSFDSDVRRDTFASPRIAWDAAVDAGRLRLLAPATEADGGGE